MARRRLPRPHYLVNLGLSIAALAVFSVLGVRISGDSSAASANPYGYADYCTLENNTTVIYGWAADPNAGSLALPDVTINAGGQAVTVPTNRAGYRDAAINTWIDQNRPGDPKPGTYGFRASLPGLYKGSKNTITGTVLNEGPGSSVILTINDKAHVDGDSSKPYFAGNVIPDVCLATAPSPAPAPTPAPAPAPTSAPPVSTGSPAPQTGGVSTANANITTGTLAAALTVPNDGATAFHILYGKDPASLTQSTSDQPTHGTDQTVTITGLDPSTAYTYQIVRTTAAGKTTTSLPSTFTTLGYVISLHFVDGRDTGIQGIRASLSSSKKTSDDNGNVQFNGVTSGNHTLSYVYHGKTLTKIITASPLTVSPDKAAAPAVVTLDFTINLEAAAIPAQTGPTHKSSIVIPLIITIGCAALLIVVVVLIIRSSRSKYQMPYVSSPPPPLPEFKPHIIPGPAPITPQSAAHTGESLKDMVLRSMAEQAKRRAAEDANNQHPPAPPPQ